MTKKLLIFAATVILVIVPASHAQADLWGAIKKAASDAGKVLTKAKDDVDETLTKAKEDTDRELTGAKEDIDSTLTIAKQNTDRELTDMKRDAVTEFEYFFGTVCGESSEKKAIERKFNQGEISAKDREEQLAELGEDDESCGASAQVDSDGDVKLGDASGNLSEVPPEAESGGNEKPADYYTVPVFEAENTVDDDAVESELQRRSPAQFTVLVPSRNAQPGRRSQTPRRTDAISIILDTIDVGANIKAQRHLNQSLFNYENTLPLGSTQTVKAIYQGSQLKFIYDISRPTVLPGGAGASSVGPFTVFGKNYNEAVKRGYRCSGDKVKVCSPPPK